MWFGTTTEALEDAGVTEDAASDDVSANHRPSKSSLHQTPTLNVGTMARRSPTR